MSARSSPHLLGALTAVALAGAPSLASATAGSAQVYNWTGPGFAGFTTRSSPGGAVTSGVADPAATDGRAVTLTFGSTRPTPARASEIRSPRQYLYGRFTNRLRTPSCADQPDAGIVTGNFTYGNNGSDLDGDGLTDNSELDFEVLCARPEILTLSIWTDYRDSDSAQQRVTRVVNLRTGRIYETSYHTDFGPGVALTGAENTPAAITGVAGFDSSTAYYDYIITWAADRVVFQVVAGGRTITLWDYRGPRSRIPQTKAAFLANVWHTADWTPPGRPGATLPPAHPVTASIDRTRIAANAAP